MIGSKELNMHLRPASTFADSDLLAVMMTAWPIRYSLRLARNAAATWVDFNAVVDDPNTPSIETLLAVVDGEVVGFVRVKQNNTHAVVSHLGVHPDHRDNGYMSKMIRLLRPYVFVHLGMKTCEFDVIGSVEKLLTYCEKRDMYSETWVRDSDNGPHKLHRQIVTREGYEQCLRDNPHEHVDDVEILFEGRDED